LRFADVQLMDHTDAEVPIAIRPISRAVISTSAGQVPREGRVDVGPDVRRSSALAVHHKQTAICPILQGQMAVFWMYYFKFDYAC
jgi:hypothetical protein